MVIYIFFMYVLFESTIRQDIFTYLVGKSVIYMRHVLPGNDENLGCCKVAFLGKT